MSHDGEDMAADELKNEPMSLRFEGDKVVFTKGKGGDADSKEATFTLDGSKTPPQITITPKDDKPASGVYELKGDTLKMAIRIGGEDKAPIPTELKPGKNIGYITLERAKP